MRASATLRLLAAIGAFQLAFFAAWTAVTVHVLAAGWSAAAAGTLAAVPMLGVLAALPATPRLARRHGKRWVARLAGGAHLAAAAALPLGEPGLWVGSALLGIGFGLRCAALDAWLIAISERAAVGRVIAVAETVAGAAMLAAPLAVRFLPADGLASTAVLLGALAVAGLACFATLDEARGEAAVASPAPRNRLVLAGVALAALAGGAFESGFMTTGPLLAAEAGRLGEALSLAALVGAGSFLLMYPFGWRADRGGAAQVLRVLALAVPAALALLAALPAALLPVAFVLGAAGGGLYTLAIVHGAQHSAPDLMPRVVAIGAGAYTVGSLVSPLMTGWWLDYVGPGSAVPMLAGLAAVAALALCAVLAPGCGEPKLAGSGARTA